MSSVLIHCSGNNPSYTKIINNLIENNKNEEVTIIDYSDILYFSNNTYNKKLAEYLRLKPYLEILNHTGFRYLRPKIADIVYKTPFESIAIDLEQSLESLLITLLRDDQPAKNFLYRRFRNMLQKDYLNVFNYLDTFFSENIFSYERTYIPNGRFPDQIVMNYFSTKASKKYFIMRGD